MNLGDTMSENGNVEAFYDYLDSVATLLYDKHDKPYLKGVHQALDFLLDETLKEDFPSATMWRLKDAKETVVSLRFPKEEVRKAVQLALLKGFKHERITNSMITPDSIGMFLAYLVKKLYGTENVSTILDPLAGPGNLLATLHNHYSEDIMFYAVDSDALLCKLGRNLLDALEAQHQYFHQDTLTYKGPAVDLIVADFPVESVNRRHTYFPYQVILHHLRHLKPGGYFIAVIENDFFDQNEGPNFKKQLMEEAHLFGLVKLDEGLFENHPQSLLIMEKKTEPSEGPRQDFLLVDLPPFRDEKAFQDALFKIDEWFKNKKG